MARFSSFAVDDFADDAGAAAAYASLEDDDQVLPGTVVVRDESELSESVGPDPVAGNLSNTLGIAFGSAM